MQLRKDPKYICLYSQLAPSPYSKIPLSSYLFLDVFEPFSQEIFSRMSYVVVTYL